ncbi:unnamed protein product [Ilex paraguariensis]|uniref:Uncharacterized protein n=1 Tax=Ilex paraguariensis TaxID=185542 RepID=A0ABC8TLV3_9AQUA
MREFIAFSLSTLDLNYDIMNDPLLIFSEGNIRIVRKVITYGSHVTLESLLKDKGLKTTIKDLIRGSGRSYPQEFEVQMNLEKADGVPEKQQEATSVGQEKVSLATQLNDISKREMVAVL